MKEQKWKEGAMSKCSVCNKKRAYMFVVGREDIGLLCCLHCIKVADFKLVCGICEKPVGCTDSPSDGDDVDFFCSACHTWPSNLDCHKCGAAIGYLSGSGNRLVPLKAFCTGCISKVRKLSKK
jgi:hypothetical protein